MALERMLSEFATILKRETIHFLRSDITKFCSVLAWFANGITEF